MSDMKEMSDDSTPSGKGKMMQDKNTIRAFFIGAGAIVILAVIALVFLLQGNSAKSFNVTSGVEEAGVYLEQSVDATIDAVNLSKFDPSDPLASIDFEKLDKKLNELSDKFKFLASPSKTNAIDLRGKTVNEVIDTKIDLTADGEVTTLSLNLNSYTQYSENYDASKYHLDTTAEMLKFFEETSDEEINQMLNDINFYITGNIAVVNGSNGSADMDVVIALIDGKGYFILENLNNNGLVTPEDMNAIAPLIGQTVSVNPTDAVKEIFSFYTDMLNQTSSVSAYNNLSEFKDSDEYKQLNTQLANSFQGMPQEELDLIQKSGPKVLNIIQDNVADLDVFINVSEVDPFSENTNSICYSGDLNSTGIVETTQNTFLDSYDVIVEDMKDIYSKSDTYADMVPQDDQIKQNRQSVMETFESISAFANLVKFNLTSCHDKDNSFSTGIGMDFDVELFGNGVEGYLNNYIQSFNSDFEMPSLTADMDLTDEFTNIFKDLSSTYDGALTPTDTYDTVDYSQYDDSYVPSQSPEEEALTNKYLAGEITYEEYVNALNDLYGL